MNIKFDKNFMLGACTSAEQSEGNKLGYKTNWDMFYELDKKAFFDQIGPSVTSDVYNQYKTDIKLYAEMGFDSFRTSFSWARLFPKKDSISKQGIEFYHNYIDEMIKNNIKPMFCLNHFDLPDWIVEMGGLEEEKVADEFVKFAKLVLDEYGSKIDYLMTFNEPIVPIFAGYLDIFHLPRVNDIKRAVKASYVTILMHSKVVSLFNNQYRNKLKTKIGVIVNITPVIPYDGINFTKQDKKAADIYNLLHNYSLLDAMVKGQFSDELKSFLTQYDLMIDIPKENLEIIKANKIDFIGINFYCPARVVASKKPDSKNVLESIVQPYSWPEARMNHFRGWEIKPDVLDDICKVIAYRYDNIPFYISENGMGVEGEEKFRDKNGQIDDRYRIAFIQEHLEALYDATKKYNSKCFGYHLWASIDNWSWLNAYKNRYGFVEVDLKTQNRKPKASFYWFKEFTKTRNFNRDYQKIEAFMDIGGNGKN